MQSVDLYTIKQEVILRQPAAFASVHNNLHNQYRCMSLSPEVYCTVLYVLSATKCDTRWVTVSFPAVQAAQVDGDVSEDLQSDQDMWEASGWDDGQNERSETDPSKLQLPFGSYPRCIDRR